MEGTASPNSSVEIDLLRARSRVPGTGGQLASAGLMRALASAIPGDDFRLWLINDAANSASLRDRHPVHTELNQQEPYVYPLSHSWVRPLFERAKGNNPIVIADEEPIFQELYAGSSRGRTSATNRLVCVPIPRKSNNRWGAFVSFYLQPNFPLKSSYFEIIQDWLSTALHLHRLEERDILSNEIAHVYETRGQKDLNSILHPLIADVLRRHLTYEGCSVFTWNPGLHWLELRQTTGLKGNPTKRDVVYLLGQGYTGESAQRKTAFLIPDIRNSSLRPTKGHTPMLWVEESEFPGQSLMVVPIMSPSRPDELLGVIRFLNRLNPLGRTIDSFSQDDESLVRHACSYIALYMERERSEELRSTIMTSMTHELKAPAAAIKGSAQVLLKRWGDPRVDDAQRRSLLNDVVDFSELQLALSTSAQLAWLGATRNPRAKTYNVGRRDLRGIASTARKGMFPVLRWEGLDHNRIDPLGWFPTLYLDANAFRQVFFNLLTNSVKYRKTGVGAECNVRIVAKEEGLVELPPDVTNLPQNTSRRGFTIDVVDSGVGVDEEEREKIFLLGYRRTGIEKSNVRGMGLGLTVARQIVENFYGHLWVHQCADPTIFRIFLPTLLKDIAYTRTEEWQAV